MERPDEAYVRELKEVIASAKAVNAYNQGFLNGFLLMRERGSVEDFHHPLVEYEEDKLSAYHATLRNTEMALEDLSLAVDGDDWDRVIELLPRLREVSDAEAI